MLQRATAIFLWLEGWVKLDSKKTDKAIKRNTSKKLHLKLPVKLKYAEQTSITAK